MTIRIQTEINLSRVIREDVPTEADLARLALETLDALAYRFHQAKDKAKANAVTAAREQLTARMREVFPD